VLCLWLALAAIVALLRKRELGVALVAIWAGLLPVIFIAPRGFYVVYLTLPGWYLMGARLLADATRRLKPAIVFAAVALLLIPLHAARREKGRWWVAEAHASVRGVLEPLRSETLPAMGKVLFVADPFEREDYILTFIFRLRYRDIGIRVDRLKVRPADPEVVYDRVYTVDRGFLARVLQ